MKYTIFPLVLLAQSALAEIPRPDRVYEIESSSLEWPSASGWRFHFESTGSVKIQSIDRGKSWLIVDEQNALKLKGSDSALSSRWSLIEEGDQLLLKNLGLPDFELKVSAKEVADRKIDPLEMEHGDVITLQSLATNDGNVYLDGNTLSGRIGLVDQSEFEPSTGIRWRVHDNEDGSYSFECLGWAAGRRWLKVAGGLPTLTNTNDKNESTRWKVTKVGPDRYSIQNLSYQGRRNAATWLDSYPAMGMAAMAQSQDNNPGTFWKIHVRKKSDYAVKGRWSSVEPLTFSGIHTHVLPDGKVLSWSRYQDTTDIGSTIEGVTPGEESTFLFDPVTAAVKAVPNSATDAFCSGHSFLPDGTLLVTGGHIKSYVGPKATQIFDYRSLSWVTSSAWDMNAGRWYPTNVTLSNGDVLTVSGDATSQEDVNRIPQVWSFKDKKWRSLNNLSSSCFNETNGPCMPLYPWLHLAPNGSVFVSGPGRDTGYIETSGEGKWSVVAKTNQGYRGDYEATSVQYAPGKILISGGVPATNSVETIDLNEAQPSWTRARPMIFKRHKHTSTLLADGTVFVSGGLEADSNSDDNSVYPSEIWNPETGEWTEADALRVPRLYHSSTVLLADGRVLSTGGGLGAGYATHKNYQIFNPPYLFRGPRPTLLYKESSSRKYGDRLEVGTESAASIEKAHLIRLSSDTHSFNSSQTIVPLEFTQKVDIRTNTQGLSIQLPTNPNIAPPGYYFLFIVDSEGIPSIGQSIQIL